MLKKYSVILIMFIFAYTGLAYGAETPKNTPDYYSMVQQLKSGKAVDFTALRHSYTKTPDYNPYGDGGKDAMFEALNKKEFARVITNAEAVLAKNYVDMDAHFLSYIAYRETGNPEKQAYHASIVKGLLSSIASSGNGQTPASAFVVISTSEEYFFLRMNGYEIEKNSLVKENSHSIDKMDVVSRKSGQKAAFYFNVDIPFNWLNSQMQKKEN